MKKNTSILFTFASILAIQLLTTSCSESAAAKKLAKNNNLDTIVLPAVELDGMSAFEAMERRRETRDLTSRSVELEVISEILWAAHGQTYSGGQTTTHGLDAVSGATLNPNPRYTFPVAWQSKFLNIYYMSSDGIFEYNPDKHALIRLSKQNIINTVSNISPNVLGRICIGIDKANFTENEKWAYLGIGMASQNIYLACASNNLHTVSVGYFNKSVLRNALDLPESIEIAYMTSFGYVE